ncbi:hypothetical protein Tco_1011418, partial [Tanacetum coccineum]
TSQDKEDPSWSTSIKTRRQRRHLQHWKRLGCHFILLYLYLIGTLPNGDALRKCILKGPYTPTIVTTPVVPATEDSPLVPEQTTVETVMNMTPENRAHFESEKEISKTRLPSIIYFFYLKTQSIDG